MKSRSRLHNNEKQELTRHRENATSRAEPDGCLAPSDPATIQRARRHSATGARRLARCSADWKINQDDRTS
jgi:hypothetical protein